MDNPWLVYGLYMVSIWIIYGSSMDHLWIWLVVGGWNPSENMTSSIGMMTFPTEWKNNPVMFQTTNITINHYKSTIHPPLYLY